MKTLQERLESDLEEIMARAGSSITAIDWLRLASLGVRCLIMIAAYLWDHQAVKD